MIIQSYIKVIQQNLSPDLLSKNFEYDENNPLKGHCYVASEVLYHVLKDMAPNLRIFRGKDENGINHWWLKNGDVIIDPTADQYFLEGNFPPYNKGIACGFLTKEPSKRAKILIDRISKLGS